MYVKFFLKPLVCFAPTDEGAGGAAAAGAEGADTVTGNAGADTIEGGAGADALYGTVGAPADLSEGHDDLTSWSNQTGVSVTIATCWSPKA